MYELNFKKHFHTVNHLKHFGHKGSSVIHSTTHLKERSLHYFPKRYPEKEYISSNNDTAKSINILYSTTTIIRLQNYPGFNANSLILTFS